LDEEAAWAALTGAQDPAPNASGATQYLLAGFPSMTPTGEAGALCTELEVDPGRLLKVKKNDEPDNTPRPFDRDRDGLVVGEGAATPILEERSHAIARGAKIHAEMLGFSTNSDGGHVTQPDTQTMGIAMQLALEDAGIDATAVKYINAHAPATDRGDVDEACGEVDYIMGSHRCLDSDIVMSNNFAFGGINTSLVFAKI